MTDDPRIQHLLDEMLDSHDTPEAVCASCPSCCPWSARGGGSIRRLRADIDALFPPPQEATPPPEGTDLPPVPGYEVVEAILGPRRDGDRLPREALAPQSPGRP